MNAIFQIAAECIWPLYPLSCGAGTSTQLFKQLNHLWPASRRKGRRHPLNDNQRQTSKQKYETRERMTDSNYFIGRCCIRYTSAFCFLKRLGACTHLTSKCQWLWPEINCNTQWRTTKLFSGTKESLKDTNNTLLYKYKRAFTRIVKTGREYTFLMKGSFTVFHNAWERKSIYNKKKKMIHKALVNTDNRGYNVLLH